MRQKYKRQMNKEQKETMTYQYVRIKQSGGATHHKMYARSLHGSESTRRNSEWSRHKQVRCNDGYALCASLVVCAEQHRYSS